MEGYSCKFDDDDRDTKSQQESTGSLCISVILCKPTEKNCEMSQKICEGPTRYKGCVESVDNCVPTACINPSVDYCLQTEVNCNSENMGEGCAITGDGCETYILCNTPSVNVSVKPDDSFLISLL